MGSETKGCRTGLPAGTGKWRIGAGESADALLPADGWSKARRALLRSTPMKRTSWNGWARPPAGFPRPSSLRRSARSWPVLVLLLSACAGSPPQQGSKPTPAAAAASSDADQLAASALALWGTNATANGSQALSQIQKAAQAAPQRPEIQWLHLRLCMEVAGCEPQSIEARLRQLDPGSGTVWLGPLARAQARRDVREEAQIVDAMTKAAHFNIYWTTLTARLSPPLSRASVATSATQTVPTPLTNSMNSTIGWLSSLTIPAFRAVTTACDEKHVIEPEIRVRCAKISQALERSDTTFAEGLGLGIAQRLAIPDSANAMQVLDRIQILRHQSQAAGAVVAAQVEKDKFSEQQLKLMAQLKKEQDVSRAILRWAGQPLTP